MQTLISGYTRKEIWKRDCTQEERRRFGRERDSEKEIRKRFKAREPKKTEGRKPKRFDETDPKKSVGRASFKRLSRA